MTTDKSYSAAEQAHLDSLGLWDHFANRACMGAEAQLERLSVAQDAMAHVADDINTELSDTRRRLTDEELRVLWRISHEDYRAFGRMVELAHGIS